MHTTILILRHSVALDIARAFCGALSETDSAVSRIGGYIDYEISGSSSDGGYFQHEYYNKYLDTGSKVVSKVIVNYIYKKFY